MKEQVLSQIKEWKPRLVRLGISQKELSKKISANYQSVTKYLNIDEERAMQMPLKWFIDIEGKLNELENKTIEDRVRENDGQ